MSLKNAITTKGMQTQGAMLRLRNERNLQTIDYPATFFQLYASPLTFNYILCPFSE